MTPLFLDASGWLAAASRAQEFHEPARAVYRNAMEGGARLVTTNLVVAEMHALLTRLRGPRESLKFVEDLYQDPTHTVIHVDRPLERAAIDRWLRRYTDQRFSLADAVSFEVMRVERIERALTLDKHFAIAGYERAPAV